LDDGAALPGLPPWFINENKWRAARYGLDASIIINAAGQQAKIRNLIPSLVSSLTETAEKLNCRAELESVLEILELGAGYERQRQVYASAISAGATQHEALETVVSHLVAEMRADTPLASSYSHMWV